MKSSSRMAMSGDANSTSPDSKFVVAKRPRPAYFIADDPTLSLPEDRHTPF